MKIEIIAHTVAKPIVFEGTLGEDITDAAATSEYAGRLCYMSFNRPNPRTAENADYLANIIDHKHLSVFEHGTVTMLFTGVSRSFTHELVRHRHFSFCLSGDTRVYSDSPSRRSTRNLTLLELWEKWQKGGQDRRSVKLTKIRTVDENGKIVYRRIKEVSFSGQKDVYEVITESGYKIKSTLSHRYMLPNGAFLPLADLSVGNELLCNGRVHSDLLKDKEWVTTQIALGRSSAELAEATGCAEVTVRKWRRIHGCPGQTGGYRGETCNKGRAYTYKLGEWSEAQKARHRQALEDSDHCALRPEQWSNGRALANRLYGHLRENGSCALCGYAQPSNPSRSQLLELDHIDNNPANNDVSNVQLLCTACHHAKTNGTLTLRVFPSKITSITHVGVEDTYDIEMDGEYPHFVANGVVVHNSQLSQRYCPNTEGYVVPPLFEGDEEWQEEAQGLLDGMWAMLSNAYDMLVAAAQDAGVPRKQAREAARAVLPNMTGTQIVVSGNHRSWREFIQKRATVHADAEIRRVAVEVFRQLSELEPNLYQDGKIEDGVVEWS